MSQQTVIVKPGGITLTGVGPENPNFPNWTFSEVGLDKVFSFTVINTGVNELRVQIDGNESVIGAGGNRTWGGLDNNVLLDVSGVNINMTTAPANVIWEA